jgi:hypothetical protein
MKSISVEQKSDIKRLINMESSDFNHEIIKLIIDNETIARIEKQIFADYRNNGRIVNIDPDQVKSKNIHEAGIWDGRSAYDIHIALLNMVYSKIYDYKDQITEIICNDFEYCKKKKNKYFQTEKFTLGISIADSLIMAKTLIPIPIIALSAYLVKENIIDKWCNCEKGKIK